MYCIGNWPIPRTKSLTAFARAYCAIDAICPCCMMSGVTCAAYCVFKGIQISCWWSDSSEGPQNAGEKRTCAS